MLVLIISPSSDSESNNKLEKQSSLYFLLSFHFLFPFSPETYLFCITAWHIEGLCWGVLVLWCLVVFGVLKVLCLGWPRILVLGRIFLLYICFCVFISLWKLPLMLAIPILFCIFANGAIWSPSTLLWFWYY